MPLTRFRLRTLMIAVAGVAVVLGGSVALERHRRRAAYGPLLRQASESEKWNRELVEALTRRIPEDPEHFRYWADYYAKQAAIDARRKRYYQRQMDRPPWESDHDPEDQDEF